MFDQLGKSQTPQQMNPMQAMQQLRANPASFLRARGLNIPQGMNSPQQIINHLLQSGQVPQGRYQQVMQNMQQFKR
jgi:hypothetical protein